MPDSGRIWRHHLSTVDEPTVDEVRRAIERDREHQRLHADEKRASEESEVSFVSPGRSVPLSDVE